MDYSHWDHWISSGNTVFINALNIHEYGGDKYAGIPSSNRLGHNHAIACHSSHSNDDCSNRLVANRKNQRTKNAMAHYYYFHLDTWTYFIFCYWKEESLNGFAHC